MFYFHFLEEKQKSDVEEDGDTVSQEEEDRKPKAEVIESGGRVYFMFQATQMKVHLSTEYFHKIIFNGYDSKNSFVANFVTVEFSALKNSIFKLHLNLKNTFCAENGYL